MLLLVAVSLVTSYCDADPLSVLYMSIPLRLLYDMYTLVSYYAMLRLLTVLEPL